MCLWWSTFALTPKHGSVKVLLQISCFVVSSFNVDYIHLFTSIVVQSNLGEYYSLSNYAYHYDEIIHHSTPLICLISTSTTLAFLGYATGQDQYEDNEALWNLRTDLPSLPISKKLYSYKYKCRNQLYRWVSQGFFYFCSCERPAEAQAAPWSLSLQLWSPNPLRHLGLVGRCRFRRTFGLLAWVRVRCGVGQPDIQDRFNINEGFIRRRSGVSTFPLQRKQRQSCSGPSGHRSPRPHQGSSGRERSPWCCPRQSNRRSPGEEKKEKKEKKEKGSPGRAPSPAASESGP